MPPDRMDTRSMPALANALAIVAQVCFQSEAPMRKTWRDWHFLRMVSAASSGRESLSSSVVVHKTMSYVWLREPLPKLT